MDLFEMPREFEEAFDPMLRRQRPGILDVFPTDNFLGVGNIESKLEEMNNFSDFNDRLYTNPNVQDA